MDAVIFDLDDTLIVEEAAARCAISEALAAAPDVSSPDRVEAIDTAIACARHHWHDSAYHESCVRLGIASWEGLWATFEGCHESLAGLVDWAPLYRQAAWADTLRNLGADPASAPRVAQRYVEVQRAGHPVIRSAIEAFRWASARMATGVLTNGPPDIQRLKLSQTGLAPIVDSVTISGEFGFGKPDPAAFLHVLDTLKVHAADAVMVGDSWERDVVGALKVDMRAIWVSYGRRPPERNEQVLVVEELSPEALHAL